MKNQALFSSKDKVKKLKCRLLQFLYGALRIDLDSYPRQTLPIDPFLVYSTRSSESVFGIYTNLMCFRGF